MRANRLPAILRRYGNPVTLVRDGRSVSARAFIQPLRRRHRLYVNDKTIPAGYFDNAYCLYIGDPRDGIPPLDSVINCDNGPFTVVASEEFFVGGEAVYVWAILRPQQDFREDDYDDLDG